MALLATLALKQLAPKQAKLDLVGRSGVFREILKACAIEVLDHARLAVPGIRLEDLLGQRVAKGGQSAVAFPVGAKRATQRVAGLGEELPTRCGRRIVLNIHRCALFVDRYRQGTI